MTEHADRIWAAARVLSEVAETEDQSGAINDLLAVANALRSTPAAPQSDYWNGEQPADTSSVAPQSLRDAAQAVSDALTDWAASGHGPHIDVMDDEGMAFRAAIKVLRAAVAAMREFRPARLNYPTPAARLRASGVRVSEDAGSLADALNTHHQPDTTCPICRYVQDHLAPRVSEDAGALSALQEVVRRFIIVCEDDYSSVYARVLAFARIKQDAEDALRAALRSTPAAPKFGGSLASAQPTLDVETLERALGAVCEDHSSCPRDTSRHRDEATAIAIEYAALRSTPAAPQPEALATLLHPFTCDPDTDPARGEGRCTRLAAKMSAAGITVATAHPAAPQRDTALTVDRLARARATDGGWKEPNVTDRKWAEQFLAILRALGEGVES